MATTDLGKWMITNGGDYDPDVTYEQLTMVMYDNSTYITLKTVTGVTPSNDQINYALMARGFDPGVLSSVTAVDTSGALGNAGETVSAQSLVDYLADAVMTKLVEKANISNVQVNDSSKVPSAALAYAMQQQITENEDAISALNSEVTKKNIVMRRLQGKKILVVGASNEELDIASSTYGPTWAEQFMSMLEGIADVTVNAAGGRMLTGSNGGAATVVANLNGNYDYIIIATSRNDFYANVSVGPMYFTDGANYNDISHSLYAINQAAISYPNTEIYMMGMFNGPAAENSYYSWTAFQEAIFTRCKRYGISFIDCAEWVGNYSYSQVTTYAPDGRHFLTQYSARIAEKLIGYLLCPTSVYTPSITETTYLASNYTNVGNNVVMENAIMRTYGPLMTMSVWLYTTGSVAEGTIIARMNLTSLDINTFNFFGNISSFPGPGGSSIVMNTANGDMYLRNAGLSTIGRSVYQFMFPIANSTFTPLIQKN